MVYTEEFKDKYDNKYSIRFLKYLSGNTIDVDDRGDFFWTFITVYFNETRKEIKIKVSMTLADGSGYWNINDNNRLLEITQKIGIMDIKAHINKHGFAKLPDKFYYTEYDKHATYALETILQKKEKELAESYKKKIGFK